MTASERPVPTALDTPSGLPTIRRRAALVVPAGACAAGLLSACGGSGEGGGSGPGGSGTPSSVEVPTSDVPVGGGKVTGGVVVTQPTEGTFHAFDARCPHQGCAVSTVTAEAITCPCHGSTFDPKTGDVTGGPSESGLAARTVDVAGGTVTVS